MSSDPGNDGRPSKRDELLAAADRVVQREGSAATMNLIAAEAGITKPILYRHFGDKVGLYRALADRHIELLLDRLREALATRGGLRARTRATVGGPATPPPCARRCLPRRRRGAAAGLPLPGRTSRRRGAGRARAGPGL